MGNKNDKEAVATRRNRFVNSNVSELQDSNRNPICGYQHFPVLKLEEATESTIPYVPDLVKYVEQAKKECNRSSDLLTLDESASIYLYTTPGPFFSSINRALRSKNRNEVKPWFAFLKLFMVALEKLPSLKMTVWRGVQGNVSNNYVAGNTQTWWSVNSCTTDLKVVEFYLGNTGTVFAIEAAGCKDISSYSQFAQESEVILMPGTLLRSKSNVLSFRDTLYIVHLEEDQENSGSGQSTTG